MTRSDLLSHLGAIAVMRSMDVSAAQDATGRWAWVRRRWAHWWWVRARKQLARAMDRYEEGEL